MVKIGILGIGRIEYWNVRYTSLHILVKKKKKITKSILSETMV